MNHRVVTFDSLKSWRNGPTLRIDPKTHFGHIGFWGPSDGLREVSGLFGLETRLYPERTGPEIPENFFEVPGSVGPTLEML